MKYLILAFVLSASIILAQPDIANSLYTYRAEVVKIDDGDTVVVVDCSLGFGMWKKGMAIRLLEVFAPETRTKDLEEKKKGLIVKDFLIKELARLAPDKKIILKTQSDKDDKYGRIIGQIWAGGVDINEALRIFMAEQGIKPGGKGT